METLKKILLVLLGVVLTLITIILVNTFSLDNTQVEPEAIERVDWDRDAMLNRFSRSIQYRTISWNEETERDTTEFLAFLDFIEREFPLVHRNLLVTMFNELTPLYYWRGSDLSLDPILLMGHYDVVPVDSSDIEAWNYAPFSGEIADGFIWGRGTLDNKFNVMSILETAEYLLANEYQPQRSIYFSFGHDEELGGTHGAREISRYFQNEGIMPQFVLDEGGAVIEDFELVRNPAALVGIAEKGYLSLELVAHAPGGHSSQPPENLAIVQLSDALLDLNANQFPVRIDGATESMFDSVADRLPFRIRVIYANRWITDRLFKNALTSDPAAAAMVRTTIAPTMLRAGIKDNVLPNEARAVVNFRILPGDNFDTVKDHVASVINNENISIREYGDIQVPPSRVSTITGTGYGNLQQSIMDFYPDVKVMPYLVMGGTDSRYFTNITDQVFRFSPFRLTMSDMGIIHSTNERVSVDSYVNSIDFYSHLIRMSTE